MVPQAQRAEWLEEWRSELWHVRRDPHLRKVTTFCLGAFKDAFWLWRNNSHADPCSSLAESPVRCLAVLAALGALCFAVAIFLPAARNVLLDPRPPHLKTPLPAHPNSSPQMFWIPLAIFLLVCMLFAMVTSGFTAGHPRKIGPRRGLFFAAKVLLVLPIVILGSLDLVSLCSLPWPVFMDISLFGSLFAARWILADQRQRCPVCLRLLANPVRMGESSRILLEWHGTELVCQRGHGLLYVPEWPAIWSGRQRWVVLGSSWGGLFR